MKGGKCTKEGAADCLDKILTTSCFASKKGTVHCWQNAEPIEREDAKGAIAKGSKLV